MANSPSIVLASLSDDQLKKSIDSLVTHVDEAMKKMVQSTNNAVGEMEAKLKSLGNLKIDSGGSADGGTGRRTQQHEKLTKAVNDASEAVSKETQKLQDLQQSLSGVSDREQNFISQKERAANTIAQENELLQRQENELNNLKSQQQSFVSSEQAKTAALNAQKQAFDVLDAKTKEYLSTQERLLQNGSGITPNERKLIGIDQQTLALIERAKRELDSFNLTLSDGTKYSKDPFSSKFQSLEILKKELDNNIRSFEQWKKETHLTTDDITKIDAVLQKYKEYSRIIDELRNKESKLLKNHDVLKFTDDFSKYFTQRIPLVKADESYQDAYWKLQKTLSQAIQTEQQKAQIDAQLAAKEKEIAETKGRIAAATKEQSEADKNASQAAKEKANIQSQVANQEKQVAEAKKQLTTATQQHTDAETKSSRAIKEKTMTFDQGQAAINTAIQSEKKYTDEIRNQAAAIRATKEWQEKGHVVIGDVNYYDKERANVSKRDKQLLLSLEEQIVQAQQNEAEAARRAAQETRNQAQAQQQVQQAATGTARIIESVHEMQRRSASFQKANASVPTFTVELESAKRLSDRLKELREQYNNMNFGQRFGKEGQAIAQQIREITRQGQRLNNELNRPTKKEVFGLSEKTLDDIAYKMRQLSTYRGGLDASKQSKEIAQVNDEYNRLKKRMDEVMQKNQQMIASNTALGRSWNYMKNRLAFYFTVGASTAFVKNLIEVRSQYEMNERALGILVNSAERGTQIFNELSQMALVSPYTLIELSAAAKQLTAYDVAAKDVVDTTRRLADMAAAVGIPIERLTYALGQIKAYGYLNARDARMFANAGIPLVKQLSEYYTELEGRLVSTADIYDRIKKKSIGYEEVTSVIAKMTDEGGKFYDFQAKMAETLKVQLANLTLAWNNMLNAMGEESQGVLVGGISTLKQVFLHWKDIEHVLYELVAALGAYKAYQIITTRLMGATAASLDAQVLAMKRNKAAMLEKQSLTRKLTYDEAKLIATQNQVTAADYRNALSGKQLTKQKALLLVALNKNNAQLKAAVVNMGLLTTQEVANITTGKALAIVFKSIGISIKSAALAMKAFAVSMWPLLVVGAIYELYHAWDSYGEHIKEVNKQAAEHAKEAFDNIKQYLESESTINTRQRVVYKEGNPLTDAESQKAWDEMREKIELSSSASNTFIAKLMQINDINSRLAAGFDYLRDVQRVAGVMQTLEEDAVNISSTVLGGLLGEGLKDDLADFINAYQKYVSLNENLRQSSVGEEYFNDQKRALEEFRGEVEKTTTSLYNIASKEGFNTNEQREFFEREISEIAQAEQMGAKETRIFRMQAEKEYYAYARAQLVAQLEYQQGAQKAATEARIKDLDNEFGTNKALQESFFTWLTEKQDHAVKNMLRGKTQEEIKQGEWLKGSNAKWVEEMARKFSKEYGVSFDDLHRLVMNANTWSINIPVFFQTIGQPLSDIQRDYEARTGKKFSSNPLIKDAKTQVDIIDTLKKKQKEVANEMETARKAGGKYWEDNKQRYKEENDALVADIHAYNALTDAEEKANKKGGKGGSKKDPLLDALKQEISLVEKLQSDYDKLSKSGASQADALETIRGAYGKTIRLLNAQLGSYGLPQIDISKLITGKDPNKTLEHFKQTLDTLISKGMLTLERSKELEAVVEKFTLSAKTYNLDMITKGLNNELGKLKDEYELAVALDADTELGSMFAEMMGININDLPRTVKEYADLYTKYLNEYLSKTDAGFQLDNLNLTNDSLRALEERVKEGTLTQAAYEAIAKAVQDVRDKRKKDFEETTKEFNTLIKKYGEYQAKMEEVRQTADKERLTFVKTYGGEEEIKQAIQLTTEIGAEKDPTKKEQLRQQLIALVNQLAGDDATRLKLKVAIDTQQARGEAGVDFEEFQKSPEWVVATGDLAGMTNKAIGGLIDSLESYKKKAKNLDSKQIKNINNALKALYKQQRSNNPFNIIGNAIMEAKERAAEFEPKLKDLDTEIKAIENDIESGKATEAQKAKLKSLKDEYQDLINKQEQEGRVSASTVVEGINNAISAAQTAVSMFNQMAEALGGKGMTDASKTINRVANTLQMAGAGAATGAQIGGGWGAAIGAVAGGLAGVITNWADVWSGNADITEKVEQSVHWARILQRTYKDLEYQMEKTAGTGKIQYQELIVLNKRLQLAELQRQLALEESRKSKNRDQDRIDDLKSQIEDMEREIQDAVDNIVNDLLGISGVGDAAESMMDAFVEALRNGEDAMKAFDESIDDMIANMIKKMFVTKILQPWLEKQWNAIQESINSRSNSTRERLATLKESLGNLEQIDDEYVLQKGVLVTRQQAIDYIKQRIAEDEKRLAEETTPTLEDIKKYAELLRSGRGTIEEWYDYMNGVIGDLGLMTDSGIDKNLSALQQGLQSMSESTANSLEAYMNGVSQQVYLHSELLMQIKDTIQGFDVDVQTATMGNILLELQQSYQIQQSIQSILSGWSTPSGLAVRAELIS